MDNSHLTTFMGRLGGEPIQHVNCRCVLVRSDIGEEWVVLPPGARLLTGKDVLEQVSELMTEIDGDA